MANFIININEKIVTPYSYKNTLIQRDENCNGDAFTESIKLSKNDTLVDTFMYLIQNYTGSPVKKLYIKDIIYSDSVKYYMEYNSIQMLPNTEYEIDITGLSPTDIIPNLLIKGNQPEKEYTNQSILFKVAIEDTLNKKHEYVNSSTTVTYKECNNDEIFKISDVIIQDNGNCEDTYFTLTGPANTPFKFKYTTISNGSNGFNGGIRRLDSSLGNVIFIELLNFSNIQSQEYTHIVNNSLNGIYYYRADICANNPPTEFSTNSVEVKLDITDMNDQLITTFRLKAEGSI